MKMLVRPKDGKPLQLNDPETMIKGERFSVSWNENEVLKGKKVPQTKVFLRHLQLGTLEQVKE